MGKHHRHGWKTMFRRESGRDVPVEAEARPGAADARDVEESEAADARDVEESEAVR